MQSTWLSEASRPAAPTTARIDAIDALRGLALFGVLAINLDSEFRVSLFEQFSGSSMPAAPLDRAVAEFLGAVVEFKAFALFALLFGVGLAIQFERLAARADRAWLLVRRLLALFALGLVHLLLIWNGDILTEYAVAGFLVLPFLFAPRYVLVLAAGVALALHAALPSLFLPSSSDWLAAHIATARVVYGHGSFAEILAFRLSELPSIAPLHLYVFPRTVALMLLGVVAWRSGLISRAAQQARRLRNMAWAAIAAGATLPALLPGASGGIAEALAPTVLAVGYAALVVWLMSCTRFSPLLTWAVPVGRTAFTNYIAQSVVLGLLFYGYGLGLMGKLGVAAGFCVALVVYAAQALVSAWWLRHHRFGPLEWLWRSLMYGRPQPWSRNKRPAAISAASA